LKPAGANWVFWGLPGGTTKHDSSMPRGTTACASLPDDFEPENYADVVKAGCQWCYFKEAQGDPNCKKSWSLTPGSTDFDNRNLRAFEQVRRFGVSGLWGRQRYVDGFTNPSVVASDGTIGANGIYVGGRTQDLVVVAGIIGVPNQLVADASGKPIDLTETQWEKIVSPDHAKRDKHMIESIMPRDGLPAYKLPANPDSTNLADFVDPISGGERDMTGSGYADLQYACIGVRASATPDKAFTDCASGGEKNPLCSGTQQPRFKAYPSLRELRVIHEVGLASKGAVSTVVASICAPSYGGAVQGVVEKLQNALTGQCIQASLTPDAVTHDVNCLIAEVFAKDTTAVVADPSKVATSCEEIGPGYCTPGALPCRVPVDPDPADHDFQQKSPEEAAKDLSFTITVTDSKGVTDSKTTPSFVEGKNVYVQAVDASGARIATEPKHLVCETVQLTKGRAGVSAADTTACVSGNPDVNFTPALGGGWCYSKEAAIIGEKCTKIGSSGTVRFLGTTRPKNGSQIFTVCLQ
jgi:hypothetical protein